MDFMVVDPNIAFATLLEQELVRLGHRVAMATSGREALALAQRQMPDMALLDMALDSPDALTLGRELRQLDEGVRLMLIPMQGDGLALAGDAPAVQGILTKPFFLPELPDAIRAALEAPLSGNGWNQPSETEEQRPGEAPSPATEQSAWATSEAEQADADIAELLAASDSDQTLDDDSLDWLADLDCEPVSPAGEQPPPIPASEPTDQRPVVSLGVGARAYLDRRTHPQPESVVTPPPVPEPATPAGAADPMDWDDLEEDEAGDRPSGVSRRAFRTNQGRIEALMRELAAEVGADGVLLTCMQGLLTAVGNLDEAEIESISTAVLHGAHTSAEVARILGREQLRFEQSIAGGSYMLYALSVHDAILAVTVSGDSALGLLRLSARSAAERIARLCVAD